MILSSRPDLKIPVLETPRLRLRAHTFEDFPASVALWSDPNVTRFIGDKPFTEEQTWARFLRYAGHWAVMGFGLWVVEEKTSGNFVGEFGYFDSKREIVPSITGFPELGWILATSAHGKGYATEGVKAVQAWGDKTFGPARTVCIIDPEHRASIRVAEKCGFKPVVQTTYSGRSTIIFERVP
jgi:RimJ/RimL family protein N-acetyltransferase